MCVCVYVHTKIKIHSGFLEKLQKGIILDGVAEELKVTEKLYG